MNPDLYDEPIHYQSNLLNLKIWKVEKTYTHQTWNKRWHYHQELELLYILEGCMNIRIEDELHKLEPGDVFVVGSGQPHVTRKADERPLIYIVLHFALQTYLDATMLTYYRFYTEIDFPLSKINRHIAASPACKEQIGQHIVRIHDEMLKQSRGYSLSVSVKVKEILLALLRAAPDDQVWETEHHQITALREVIDYINHHLADTINMHEISEMMNMNYHYFSKYFKKMIGLSFKEYINLQRIKKAERLLLTEEMNIAQIAEQVGITNMAHFYKLFRRCNHCSPKQFIHRMTTKSAQPSQE